MMPFSSLLRPFALLGALLLLLPPAFACLNTYHYNAFGRGFSPSALTLGFFDGELQPSYSERRDELLQKIEKEHDTTYQTLSDYATMLIFLQETAKGKSILAGIEKRHPGLYNTAINLGTAYELLGQNDSALYWIKRGLEINPGSHDGSEWIHVRVLEAKIALGKQPAWLRYHTVLGYDFGEEDAPEDIFWGRDSAGLLLIRQLSYQLKERLFFVKAPDPTVADLLFTLANAQAILGIPDDAAASYDRAIAYGYQPRDLAERRKEWILKRPLSEKNPKAEAAHSEGRPQQRIANNADAASRKPKPAKPVRKGLGDDWKTLLLLVLIPIGITGAYAWRQPL